MVILSGILSGVFTLIKKKRYWLIYILGDDNYRICFDTFVKEQEERVAKNSERDN